MIDAAFAALQAEVEPNAPGPVGVCVVVTDPAVIDSRPEAIWPGTKFVFAGYLDGGAQVRLRYFEGAPIGPGLPDSPDVSQSRNLDIPLEDRYRIEPFAEGREATPDDVLSLWRREEAMPDAEARRRIHEVKLVAIERTEGVVGVGSAYLQRNPQLRMDMWHGRIYVAEAHRKSNLAVSLELRGREFLEQLFLSGEDTRAPGVIIEVENEGLKRYFNKAVWTAGEVQATFIGENARGDHVRVNYFQGALVPPLGSAPADV